MGAGELQLYRDEKEASPADLSTNTSFLVGNHLSLIALAGIIFPVVCCGAISITERFYVERTEVHAITDWRLAVWAPSFVCGWAIS